jgi:hypothetical protein
MLPVEILDHIFSFLQKDRAAQTLRSCSAAHPLLSSVAERHLFVHTIVYGNPSRDPPPNDGFLVSHLARCLTEGPHRANHIRSIAIQDNHHTELSAQPLNELSTILPLIQRAEEISLCSIRWSSLPKIFLSALLDCFRTPYMKQICLKNSFTFPLSILDNFKNIKSLKVDSSFVGFRGSAANSTSTSLESLFLLDVGNISEFLTWATPRVNSLISLHVKTVAYSFPNLSPILNACKLSLTNLTLEIGTSCTFLIQIHINVSLHFIVQTTYRRGIHSVGRMGDFPINLSSLACLEVVTFGAEVAFSEYPLIPRSGPVIYITCDSPLLAITRLVGSAGPSLKRVVLNFICRQSVMDLFDAMEWGPLALFCNSVTHLKVDLCIHASGCRYRQLPFVEVVDLIIRNEELARFVEQGSLVIKQLFAPGS